MSKEIREKGAKSGVGTGTKIAIVLALAVAVGAVIQAKRNTKGTTAETKQQPSVVTQKGDQANARALGSDQSTVPPQAKGREETLPRLVDLGADKCIPCKMMAPILDELKKEYAGRMDVEVIDVWKHPGAGKQHGVRMIPTQIFFDASGKELYRHQGFYSKEDILAKWKELGVDLGDENDSESK